MDIKEYLKNWTMSTSDSTPVKDRHISINEGYRQYFELHLKMVKENIKNLKK